MSLLSWKKPLLSDEENARIVAAIRTCEHTTSGEIRVYIESRNPLVSTIERSADIFFQLQMQKTIHRNAVLLYIALKDHEVAIFGDEGIYREVGSHFWEKEVQQMLQNFREQHVTDGIIQCILDIGQVLTEKFPFIPTEDKNELPDEIVFGK